MQKLVLSGIFLFLIVFPSYAFADGPYLNIPPTNAFDKVHTDSGTVSASNFSMPLNIVGGTGITVSGNNGTHTVTITNTGSSGSTIKGTYNQTYANNVLVNSLGNRINFLNGTNSTVNVVDDPTRNQVNVTISSTGGSGSSGVSSLNALTGALTIACVAGNTTCTTSGGNTITINTAYNIATLNLNEIFSGITTMNSLKLGGQMNINNNSFQSLGHVYTWPNNTGTICLTNQTGSCGPGSSATYDTLVNIGTGEASVYAGNTTKTNFQFKTLKQGSHITLTNNTNDVTIATTGLLSSAITSLNGDTTASQVVASGNTNHITVTNAGATHSIDIVFKVNNATCSSGYFVSAYSNVTGIYTCSLGNSGTITGGSNIGTSGVGFFKNSTGNTINLRNLTTTRTDLFTLTQSSNNVNIASSFKSNNITCAAGNAVTSFNNSTGTYTCSPFGSLSSAITSVNSQTGPSISITRQPSYTTITNSTNNIKIGIDAAGVMELNGTQTATGAKTFSGGITMSGSDINLGTNALTNSGHKSTLPLTSGTLCQTNQSSTCGTNSGVTSITGTAHNVTASSSTGAVILNTGDNVVVTGLSQQNITKNLIIFKMLDSSNIVGASDQTKKLDFLLSGMTTAKTLTIRSNQTTSQGLNIPNISTTDTLPTLGLGQTFTGNNIWTNNANNFTDRVKVYHSEWSGDQGGAIELGGLNNRANPITNGVPYIDWHFGNGKAQDYNIRIMNNANNTLFIQNPTTGTLIQFGDQITSYVRNIWTPISDPTTSFTNAIWKSSTTADVLKYRNNANTTTYNILSTLGAVTISTPADPTATTSTTAKMMGLAGSITPAVSTRVDVTICGQMANSLINDGVTVQLRYGTGTAPTNGATLTGTQLGASQTVTEKVAAQSDGFCVTGIATGLTIGTAYWLDTAVNAVTAGSASITGVTIKAHEV